MVLPRASSPTIKANGLTEHSAIRLSVYPSTSVLPAVNEVPSVITATPALCASICHTDAQDAPLDTIYPIVTKLKADAWELALEDAGILSEFIDIPVGLREGFLCGLEHFSLASTFIPISGEGTVFFAKNDFFEESGLVRQFQDRIGDRTPARSDFKKSGAAQVLGRGDGGLCDFIGNGFIF